MHTARFQQNMPLPGAPTWTLRRPIGRGGFGEVWLAERTGGPDDAGGPTRAAVKWFPGPGGERAFEREVKATGRISRRLAAYPGIVAPFMVNRDVDPPWIAYEFVDGKTLAFAIKVGRIRPQSWRSIRKLAEGIVETITEAHCSGIVHGDLSLTNILVTRDGKPRVTDFGHATVAGPLETAAATEIAVSGEQSVSLAGRAGTRLYLSPERAAGAAATKQDDVYAVAVILFQMLVGDPTADPRYARTLLGRTRMPRRVRRVLLRCLEAPIDERPFNGNELLHELFPEPTATFDDYGKRVLGFALLVIVPILLIWPVDNTRVPSDATAAERVAYEELSPDEQARVRDNFAEHRIALTPTRYTVTIDAVFVFEPRGVPNYRRSGPREMIVIVDGETLVDVRLDETRRLEPVSDFASGQWESWRIDQRITFTWSVGTFVSVKVGDTWHRGRGLDALEVFRTQRADPPGHHQYRVRASITPIP